MGNFLDLGFRSAVSSHLHDLAMGEIFLISDRPSGNNPFQSAQRVYQLEYRSECGAIEKLNSNYARAIFGTDDREYYSCFVMQPEDHESTFDTGAYAVINHADLQLISGKLVRFDLSINSTVILYVDASIDTPKEVIQLATEE